MDACIGLYLTDKDSSQACIIDDIDGEIMDNSNSESALDVCDGHKLLNEPETEGQSIVVSMSSYPNPNICKIELTREPGTSRWEHKQLSILFLDWLNEALLKYGAAQGAYWEGVCTLGTYDCLSISRI